MMMVLMLERIHEREYLIIIFMSLDNGVVQCNHYFEFYSITLFVGPLIFMQMYSFIFIILVALMDMRQHCYALY